MQSRSGGGEAESGEARTRDGEESVSSNVIRGTTWTFLGRILPQSYLLISSVVSARILGADKLGQLAFITFTAATLGTLLTLGFPSAVARHVAEAVGRGSPDEIAGLQRWSWRFGWPVAAIATCSMWLVALLGGEPRAAWILAGVYSGCVVLHQIPSNLLMGARRWRDAMIIGTTTGFISTFVRIAVLIAGGGIVGVIAVDAAVGVVNVVFTSLLARRCVRALSRSPVDARALIRRTIRFGLVGSITVVITWVVFRRSEIFLLQYFSTSQQVAVYSIPFTMVETLLFFPRSMTFVLAPTFAMLFGAGEQQRLRDGFGRSLRIVTTFTIVTTAYAMLVGPATISLLYGSQFDQSGAVLRILLVTFPIVPLMTLSTALLNGIGRQWFATAVLSVATVVNLTFDVVLIRRYDAIGAATANCCAQIFASLPLAWYARRQIGGAIVGWWTLTRVLVLSATAALVGLPLVDGLGGLTGIVLSSGAYVLVLVGMGRLVPILSAQDADVLIEKAGGRAKGLPRSLLFTLSGRRRPPAVVEP